MERIGIASSSSSSSSSSVSRNNRGVAAIVGVGPGLGFSIARRFAREGYSVVMLSRTYEKIASLVVQLMSQERTAHVSAISIDCSDLQSVRAAFESVRTIGVVEVLVYNVPTSAESSCLNFLDINADSFRQSLTLPALGAFYTVQQVLPGMLQRRRGTILFTGAADSTRGEAGSALLGLCHIYINSTVEALLVLFLMNSSQLCTYSKPACGKFALRALSQCLSKEFETRGIHVAHVILDGAIRCNRSERRTDQPLLEPDSVAEVYWQIHMQHPTAWTHELDLRPVGR